MQQQTQSLTLLVNNLFTAVIVEDKDASSRAALKILNEVGDSNASFKDMDFEEIISEVWGSVGCNFYGPYDKKAADAAAKTLVEAIWSNDPGLE